MRTNGPKKTSNFVLLAWVGVTTTQVDYFDDEDEARYAYDKAPKPSKLFRLIAEDK